MKHRVVHYIDSQGFGGAELILFNLLCGLDPKRWESVLVYHSHPGIAPFIEKVNELDIEIISLPPIKRWTNISRMLELIRKLRVLNATVFHAQMPWYLSCSFGVLCAFLARVPAIVATQHLYIEISPNRLYILQKLVSMIVDRYIAVSDGVAGKLSRLIFSPNKIRVVKNGISVEDFHSTRSNTLRDLLKKNKHMPIVLTVARLDKQKGHEYLLEAASMVPDAVFVLVGDGPERERLETYVNETSLDDRVVFLGHRQDIREILSGCDLFVLPSLYEGLPLSILEAMAAGRPVIASDINGTDEIIIDGKTGILVPPADPRAIAEAIRRILSDPSLARNLADSGKKRAHSEFSSKKMVEGVTRVYDDIIREKKAK
ncbi:MAG: glycosyltransferase [Deltaproteobacteria bacterium]